MGKTNYLYFRSSSVLSPRKVQSSLDRLQEEVDPRQLEVGTGLKRLPRERTAWQGCQFHKAMPVPVRRHPMEAHRQEDREGSLQSRAALEPVRERRLNLCIMNQIHFFHVHLSLRYIQEE